MLKFRALVLCSLLLFILFPTPSAFAGGGGVYPQVSGTDDPHWNTVRVYFDPSLFPCKDMRVTFSFETPADGDQINGSNGDNSSTINSEASFEMVEGKQYLRCSTYAKVYSQELKWNRIFYISFEGQNLVGSRKIAISFEPGLNLSNFPLLPWEGNSTGFIPNPTTSEPKPSIIPQLTSSLKNEIKPTYLPNPTTKPEVTPAPTGNDEQLNKKIASLEAQLAETKVKQNTLEQRINNLISFIKHFFPFFK